jgi:hypothetical protein
MTVHECRRCGYSTIWAKDIAKHLHKPIPCTPTDLDHFIPRDVLLEELQVSKRKYVRKAPAAPSQQPPAQRHEALVRKIARLQSRVNALTTKRDEYFYQNWLERRLGGSHMKLQSGVTDITTDTCHAEIKEWKSWKAGVGQLLAYNSELRRQEVALYLFGAPVACDVSVMVNTFQKAGVTHVYQLEPLGEGEVQVQPIFISPGQGWSQQGVREG